MVMLEGIFNKATAYLGNVGSVVGLAYIIGIFVPALVILLPIEVIIFGVWFSFVGSRLRRLGKR